MRILGMIGLVSCVGLAPRIAVAGRHDGDNGPTVRDHRSHDDSSAPTVRDHRSHDDSSAPTVRDHRTHDEPVVRDHRTHDDPVVRDHRGNDTGGAYFASTEEVVVDDGPSSPGPSLFDPNGPSWTLEIGGIARRFRGPAVMRSSGVETTTGDFAYYDLTSGSPATGDTAGGGLALRFAAPLGRHYYVGTELELGGLTRSPVQLMTDSSEIHISSRAMIGTDLVAGARARHGIAELDGEVAGGLRVLSMTVQSFDAGEDDPSETENAVSGILEARLRGLLWVSPHVYLAAQAGVSAFDRDDVNVGLSIGLTSHAFGEGR